MSFSDPEIYIIEGCIGTGKSTFIASTLAYAGIVFGPRAKLVVIRESIYQPFLDLYLDNQSAMAFPFQICMARDRIEAMRMAQRHRNKGRIVLVDRGIPGDIAFAKLHRKAGNITSEQMQVYFGMLGHGVPHFIPATLVPKVSCSPIRAEFNFEASEDDEELGLLSDRYRPARIVYLRANPNVAFKRMQKRGNPSEVLSYKLQYFRDLCDAYQSTIDAFKAELPAGSVKDIRYNGDARVNERGLISAEDCFAVWCKILAE